jgi:GntP family gluconate:H+ symporter
MNTLCGALGVEGLLAAIAAFIGNPNFALLISTAVAVYILMKQKGYALSELQQTMETAFASGGLIILITAGGGSFGGMLQKAGVGATLGDMSASFGVPLLLLSFLLGALLKVAQGSGTVSMITVSAIMAPLVTAGLPYNTVYIACAIGSGSLVGSWMNDSGFWIYTKMSGLTEAESLKTWTPLLTVLGVTGYIVTQILSIVMPLN